MPSFGAIGSAWNDEWSHAGAPIAAGCPERRGRVVESGAARAVLDNPQHPYSILLKESVLSPETIGEGILGSAGAEDRQRPGRGESVA